MPAPSGRSKAASASAASGKASTGLKKRKSLATDSRLLQSDGESGSDAQDPEPAEPVQRKTSKAASTASKGKATAASSRATAPSVAPTQVSPGSRRSTRLSGEGVQSGGSDNEASTSARQRAAKAPGKSAKIVPTKRKQPAGTSQPTPPLTDSDEQTEQARMSKQSQSSGKSGKAGSGDSRAKKVKADGNRTSPARKAAAVPLPRLSEVGDDSFAFLQVGESAQAEPTQTASTSASMQRASAGPSKSSSSKTSPGRTNTSGTKASADLLQSLDAVAPRLQPENVGKAAKADPKGKRRADALDASNSANEASQATTAVQREITKADRSKKKKKKDQTQNAASAEVPQQAGTPDRQMSVPTNTQETPAIRRNQAMRAGIGPPGTPGSTMRRSSSDRGRRGSSIGNGFEAVPHPSLPTNTFYRHIKADDPPAIRFRTLATWTAHRVKDGLEAKAKEDPSAMRKAAVGIAEALIKDLVEKRVDISWTPEDTDAQDEASRNLPPNPENLVNQDKLEACQAWTARLRQEDDIRNARIHQYKGMTESITALINNLPPAPAPLPDGTIPPLPDVITPNFSQPLARLRTREDMLQYGRTLLQPKAAPSRRKSVAPPPSAQEGDADPDVVNADIETGFSGALAELRTHAASLHQSAHRLDQFLKVSDIFLDQQLEETQKRLRDLALPAESSTSRGAAGENAGLQIAGVPGAGNSERQQSFGLTDLLRGISRTAVATKASSGRKA